MVDNVGDELKKFKRFTSKIRTQVSDLQDSLTTSVEGAILAADFMDNEVCNTVNPKSRSERKTLRWRALSR